MTAPFGKMAARSEPRPPEAQPDRMNDPQQDDLFASLHALVESTFPKRCRNCGREYADAATFIAATQPVSPGVAGFKASHDEHNHPILELFRNCPCGSTLLESFEDRRDDSAAGLRRRERFGALLGKLEAGGITRQAARHELLLMIRGEPNNLFELIRSISPA